MNGPVTEPENAAIVGGETPRLELEQGFDLLLRELGVQIVSL
jgi:hypothetical protein